MKNWHKITEKLAPINKLVMILNDEKDEIYTACLRACGDPHIFDTFSPKLDIKIGDIYWFYSITSHDDPSRGVAAVSTIKDFPYWIETKKLIQISTINEITTTKTKRLEILDL